MIKSEIIKGGTILHQWTDQPGMELLQEDTGIQYGWEVYDIAATLHTYSEVPKKEQPESMDTEKDRLRAENARMREALNVLGVQTE